MLVQCPNQPAGAFWPELNDDKQLISDTLLAFRFAQLKATSWITITFPAQVRDSKSFSVPTIGNPELFGSRLELANHPVK